jgi:hypothetical protein
MADFCLKCGASFPPRLGEGRCVDWLDCWKNQGTHTFKELSEMKEANSKLLEREKELGGT